ncbi:MAG: elongation factor G [Cyclobacteriaceae bacterium]
MQVFDDKHIKNIVLLGSSKSGKTTLAETMLFEAGLINRRGTVEDHNTVSDYHTVEHDREGSVYTTLLHTEWRNYKINILDTPGMDDFVGEVISAVRVADTCVYLINAQHGVEVGTELVWEQVDQHKKPTLFVINQLDHAKSDFESTYNSLKAHYGNNVTLMQFPVNEGPGFNGIIDLLKMRYYQFGPKGGKPEKLDIPEAYQKKAERLHNELVEKAAENDEGLMELYFEKGTLNENELKKGLKIGMMNHDVFPVFAISAKEDMGSGRLMGFIDNVAPSAADALPDHTKDGAEIEHDITAPTELFVFKTTVEPNLGKMTYFKVVAGQIKEGDELLNLSTGQTERISSLFIIDGHERVSVPKLVAGDIGATLKLKNTHTNETLAVDQTQPTIAPMNLPEPRIYMAISVASHNNEEKLGEILHRLTEEDPTIIIKFSNETKELLVGCQGELHLSVIKWTLLNVYHMGVIFSTPRISYRETINQAVASQYRHKKQSGGAGQFAELSLKMMPYVPGMDDPDGFNIRGKEVIDLEWGGKLVFYNCIVGGSIDHRFMSAILKGIMEEMESGPLTGSYVRDIVVLVDDGKMHTVDSNDIAFKMAAAHAFREAFSSASPTLMEPVSKVQVFVHEDIMGEVMTDLQTRRAIITGMDASGAYQVINAKVPQAELDNYTTALRSMTKGRSRFTSAFDEFMPVPFEVQQKVTQGYQDIRAEA